LVAEESMTQEQKRLEKLVRKLQAKAAKRLLAKVANPQDHTVSSDVAAHETRAMFAIGKKRPYTD
jgi:hypothetical protein